MSELAAALTTGYLLDGNANSDPFIVQMDGHKALASTYASIYRADLDMVSRAVLASWDQTSERACR